MPKQALLPCYLAVGGNELKREAAVKRLKARLDEGLSAFNLDEREAGQTTEPAELEVSLNTLPVGDDYRLVIVHGAGKLPKPVSEAIVSYLKNPNPSCVLLLDAESLAKNTRLYKAVAKVGARSIIDCAPPKATELPAHVKKWASRRGYVLDDAAARELVARVGDSTTLLDSQLTTLMEICAETRRITVQDVAANVSRTAEVKPWEFLDKVAAGDAEEALALLHLLSDSSALGLVTLLVRRIRDLTCAKCLIDRGQARQVASALKKADWQVRGLVNWARRFTQEDLAACLGACAQAERDLKSGADDEAVMTMLVLRICKPDGANVLDRGRCW